MQYINTNLIELIFILLHAVVCMFNYVIARKKVFHPSVLFSLLWTTILSLHLIFKLTVLKDLFPLGLNTHLVLFFGVVSFSLASFFVTMLYPANKTSPTSSTSFTELPISFTLRLIFIGILIIGLPFYIQASIRVFLASNLDNFIGGLRSELSYGEEDIGPTKYLVSFSFVVFAINFYASLKENSRWNKTLLLLSFLLGIVFAVLATGRTYFFIFLSIYMGVSFLLKKNFSFRRLLILLAAFLLFFTLFGILYGKGGDFESSFKNNLQSTSETTGIYLVTSINALDIELQNKKTASYPGENTIRFFVKIAQQLKLLEDRKVGNLISEFVFIPYPTNVYTFYSAYIRDFGKWYAWFMIALFGGIHTLLYHNAVRKKDLRNVLYYSFLLFPLLLSFFSDQYMSLFSFWLQVIFFIEIFIFLNKYVFRKKVPS